MAIGRQARRAEREARVEAAVGKDSASAALDLLELVEYAWHDCYDEVTPPEEIIDNILTCAQGDLAEMIVFAQATSDRLIWGTFGRASRRRGRPRSWGGAYAEACPRQLRNPSTQSSTWRAMRVTSSSSRARG